MRQFLFFCLLFAAASLEAATLVDFAHDGGGYYLMSARFRDPENEPRQLVVGENGLTVRFDSRREKTHPWATLAIPAAVGNRIDWNGRDIEVVFAGIPEGRVKRSATIDFSDDDGEIFQLHPKSSVVDEDGNLRIAFRVDVSLRPGWSKSWGGKVNNNKVDGKLKLISYDVTFLSQEGTGSLTLARIDEVEPSNAVRNVCSLEPISTDTTYPGAKPFPGAERLAFKIEPAFDGSAALELSTESTGSAMQGKRLHFHAAVSNGVARFATDLPYENQYEFYKLVCAPAAGSAKGPFKPVKAGGLFRQTAAEALRLDVDTKNELHVCRDESERPELIVANPAKVPLRWRADFVGRDFFGRTFEIPFDRTVGAGETVRLAVPWPLPAKGFWRVTARVRGEDGSKAKKEVTFAYIDRHERTPPAPHSQFKFGMHYHGTQYLPDHVDRTIAAMVACGVKLVRTDYDFMFGAVERPQGVYHWEKADCLLKKLRDAGMSLDIIVGGTPGWSWDPEGNWAKTKPTSRVGVRPSKPGLFRDFCEQIARRYGTEIEYYEAGNEWDFSPAAVLTPDEAVRMQRECFEGVKKGCPAAKVSTCGWAHVATADLEGSPDKVNKGLVEAVARHAESFDVWSLHGHGPSSAYYRQIDDIFLPLRAATSMKSRPWMSNESSQTGAYGEERDVTRTVWQKILFAWSRGSHDFIWYNLRATGWFDGHEPGFGIITPDYHPRATYAAFSALTAIFSGLEYDGAIYSRKLRHLLCFKGRSDAVDGLALAVWDEADETSATRPVRLKTDAKRVWHTDLMGNRSPVKVCGGVFVAEPVATPQAYLLDGATSVSAVDSAELPPAPAKVREIDSRDKTRAADFTLNETKHVKDFYAANPATTDRLWKGPADHSAKVWLGRSATGELTVRVDVTDDVVAAGDGVEVVIERLGEQVVQHSTFNLKPQTSTASNRFYEATLPVKDPVFGFDIHVWEDDGDGADGYLRLVNESEDPVRVHVK